VHILNSEILLVENVTFFHIFILNFGPTDLHSFVSKIVAFSVHLFTGSAFLQQVSCHDQNIVPKSDILL